MLGFACMTQADLSRGLRALCSYLGLWIDGFTVQLEPCPEGAWVTLSDAQGVDVLESPTRRLLRESLLASTLHAARQLSQEPWRPLAVQLRHHSSMEQAWRQLMGLTPVVGPAPRFLVPADALTHALRYAEGAMASFFERHARALIERQQEGERVTKRVRQALLMRFQLGDASLRSVGRSLALSPRSLQRKLADEGRRYSDLVEETRRVLALRLLEDPRVVTTSVCFLLGYSDDRSFRRAFERWTGLSPAAWRQRASRGDG